MQYGKIEGVDKPVSRLAQGTMMFRRDDVDWTYGLLDDIVATGCNTFDLAHGYCGGDSERMFGDWMKARNNRDDVVILTKGSHPNPDRKRVRNFDIAADLHDSLARLDVETIDIYVLHRDDPDVEVAEIVDELNKHHEAGRIGVFGGSNWTPARIAEANEYAAKNGLQPFTVSSPNFSLADMVESPWGPDCISISGPSRAAERQWYHEQNMPLFTWSSLARGFFCGKVTRQNAEEILTQGPNRSSIKAYCHEVNFQRLDRVEQLAKEKGVSVPQIATAYVASQDLNIFSLIGCYSGKEFGECVDAWELKLTDEEMEWLDLRRDER